MDSEILLAQLAEPERLRVCAALVLGNGSVPDISAATGLSDREVERALGRLLAADLVARDPSSGYRFVVEELKAAARLASMERRAGDDVDAPESQARVLRNFFKGGRLVSIPVPRAKRRTVLDHVAWRFEPGVRYAEAEVNARLARIHDDVAALRRYLVDEGFMARERGVYWRAGGSVDLD